jgi:hypothetical protein
VPVTSRAISSGSICEATQIPNIVSAPATHGDQGDQAGENEEERAGRRQYEVARQNFRARGHGEGDQQRRREHQLRAA